jgi:hypothetical protein
MKLAFQKITGGDQGMKRIKQSDMYRGRKESMDVCVTGIPYEENKWNGKILEEIMTVIFQN